MTEIRNLMSRLTEKKNTYTLPPRKYNTGSCVDLVRFIRNAIEHASDVDRSPFFRRLVLNDCIFLDYFPNLVMEVYKAVTKHGWITREEVQRVVIN